MRSNVGFDHNETTLMRISNRIESDDYQLQCPTVSELSGRDPQHQITECLYNSPTGGCVKRERVRNILAHLS